MASSVKERLQAYLKYKGISQTFFGNALGASAGYVSSIAKTISNEKILLIRQKFSDLNTDWLLYGVGNMILNEDETGQTEPENGDLFEVIRSQQKTIESLSATLQTALDTIKEMRKQYSNNVIGGGVNI